MNWAFVPLYSREEKILILQMKRLWISLRRSVTVIQTVPSLFPLEKKAKESYRLYKEAGADRYLLRHETANEDHYRHLHPEQMSLANRKQCLRNLKELGYQTGAGFMVGAPGQTLECLAEDLIFLKELNPEWWGSVHLSPIMIPNLLMSLQEAWN